VNSNAHKYIKLVYRHNSNKARMIDDITAFDFHYRQRKTALKV